MNINFYLRYNTRPGEDLHININLQESEGIRVTKQIPMHYLNEEFWQASLLADASKAANIHYSYTLARQDGSLVNEGDRDREIDLSKAEAGELRTIDTWNNEGDYENVFYTAPFQNVLLAENKAKVKIKAAKSFTHIFKVKAPLLREDEVLILSGSSLALGNWNKADALLMTKEGAWWTVKVTLPNESFPLEYKYGIYNVFEKEFVAFEGNGNRHLHGTANKPVLTVLHDGFARFPNNTWKGAGVAVPVFGLKTDKSFGVGEFTDLMELADWAKTVGLKLIQILPVNDTTATHTFTDSYPYAAISAFALHPIYINLERVAGKKNAALMKSYKNKQKEFNDLPELEYVEVMKHKLAALKQLCAARKEEYAEDKDFQAFFTGNRHWLVPYAAFSLLRDRNGTADFSQWKEYGVYNKEAIEAFVSPGTEHYDEIFLSYFTQYHLHLQLKEATAYAHKKGIIVKGDIPIGIYRHSCDAWVNPGLYNMDVQAGAPPDAFAVKGQNWGFPTYNWKRMEEDGFAWWRQRFEQMSNYFDAFRIDHILGFFRIWSIPFHAVEGIMGYFVPAVPVHVAEFGERNIWFDKDRYTRPFITDGVLNDFFGGAAAKVKAEYLDELSPGWYALKEAFNTQKKVDAYFKEQEHNDENRKIKYGLFDLISNIILFEVPDSDGTQFHFRINMADTASFKNLDGHTQNQLRDLYVNYFFRRQDDFWKKEAMKKLPALKRATNMLICGEDLGMVPHCVPEVMQQLGILSLEIQRMPKDVNRVFFHPNDAPYLSVVTPSTHDMSTIRGWWEEDRAVTQKFYNHELGQWGDAPYFCEPWVNKAVILQHIYAPSMWSIFQLQDLFGMNEKLRRENPDEERINIPSNPIHYWRYRMHSTIEEVQKADDFNNELKKYIQASGRA